MKWYIAGLIVLAIVIWGLVIGAKLAQGEFSIQNTEYAPQVAESLNLGGFQRKDPAILAKIDRLAECESSNRWNIKVLDTNNRYSYGGLQFQKETFLRANRKYKVLPDLEDGEFENAIYDEWTQRELAYHILEDGGSSNWKICYASLD